MGAKSPDIHERHHYLFNRVSKHAAQSRLMGIESSFKAGLTLSRIPEKASLPWSWSACHSYGSPSAYITDKLCCDKSSTLK